MEPQLERAVPPATVLVPSEPMTPGDQQARLVLRLVDGEVLVLPAYSSLGELVRCCGPDQPWVALHADVADSLVGELGAAAVVLDAVFTDLPADTGDSA